MQERLEKRLQELRAEYKMGQKKLADLDAQANVLRNTLLRISGAIQVLEEELGQHSSETDQAIEQPEEELQTTAEPEAA